MLGCSTFVAASVCMVWTDPRALAGWSGMVVFGFGFVVAVIRFLPGASDLMLTREGFSFRLLLKRQTVPWGDLEYIGRVGKNYVGWCTVPNGVKMP